MTAHDAGGLPPGFEGYREVLEGAALEDQAPVGLLVVSGRDAVSFLHGVLTNDIKALAPGDACYAAYLTPQGRMVSDMHVLRRQDDVLLLVEPPAAASLAERFDRSIFTEDVRIDDRSAGAAALTVHARDATRRVAAALDADAAARAAVEALGPRAHVTVQTGGDDVTLVAGDWLGAPGMRVVGPPEELDGMRARLLEQGTVLAGRAALEARRVEAGLPRFGVDMTTDTIPLEAGIEGRAINTTKGCYVGQEIIVRILHRAHGRVARRLMGLVVSGPSVPAAGTLLHAGGREVGAVTSASWSPALGAPIAMAMLHRDAFEPGTLVALGGPAGDAATVRELPLVATNAPRAQD